MVTRERLLELFDYDQESGLFTYRRKTSIKEQGAVAGYLDGKGYRRIRIDKKTYPAHWLAWLVVYGRFPSIQIDHINRIKTDNRIANLREATGTENARNRGMQKNNRSGHTGVYWAAHAKKWTAQIKVGGRQVNLGRFSSKELAILVRKRAERELGFSETHGRIDAVAPNLHHDTAKALRDKGCLVPKPRTRLPTAEDIAKKLS